MLSFKVIIASDASDQICEDQPGKHIFDGKTDIKIVTKSGCSSILAHRKAFASLRQVESYPMIHSDR